MSQHPSMNNAMRDATFTVAPLFNDTPTEPYSRGYHWQKHSPREGCSIEARSNRTCALDKTGGHSPYRACWERAILSSAADSSVATRKDSVDISPEGCSTVWLDGREESSTNFGPTTQYLSRPWRRRLCSCCPEAPSCRSLQRIVPSIGVLIDCVRRVRHWLD